MLFGVAIAGLLLIVVRYAADVPLVRQGSMPSVSVRKLTSVSFPDPDPSAWPAVVPAAGRIEAPAAAQPQYARRRGMVLVHSVGGVGTSRLMARLTKALRGTGQTVNSVVDHDGLKHRPYEETLALLQAHGSVALALYVYDDPAHAVLSLFRRGYFAAQMHKLTGATADARTERSYSNITVEEYAAARQDSLAFEKDFASWLSGACRPARGPSFPVVFLRRSQLWRHFGKLATLLPIDLAALPAEETTPHQSRHKYPARVRESLDATYARLHGWYALLGDFVHIPDSYACISDPQLKVLVQAVGQTAGKQIQ
jgi:hypothetical protein